LHIKKSTRGNTNFRGNNIRLSYWMKIIRERENYDVIHVRQDLLFNILF